MKSISRLIIVISLFLIHLNVKAGIHNAKKESAKIFGNCSVCKSTIEKAGNAKNTAEINWNPETKVASITFDAKKTNADAILKRIALAGYDNDRFLAPHEAYVQLEACCKYERANKLVAIVETTDKPSPEPTTEVKSTGPLQHIMELYFGLKDALVKSDGPLTALKAKELQDAINAVKLENLKGEEHLVWMKVNSDLAFDAGHIAGSKAPEHQRDHFMSLSKNMHSLAKVVKSEAPVYYQFCPMANEGKGANWLSKENSIKNPYYGSQMSSCGKTVEVIK